MGLWLDCIKYFVYNNFSDVAIYLILDIVWQYGCISCFGRLLNNIASGTTMHKFWLGYIHVALCQYLNIVQSNLISLISLRRALFKVSLGLSDVPNVPCKETKSTVLNIQLSIFQLIFYLDNNGSSTIKKIQLSITKCFTYNENRW